MKFLSIPALALLAACATPQPEPEPRLDPTGSYPDAGAGTLAREAGDRGVLVVHSPRIEVFPDGREFEYRHRAGWDATILSVNSPYRLFDPEGRLVADVVNHSPLLVMSEGPADILLPPGRYLVQLKRPGRGLRIFWVTIGAGQRTVVDPEKIDPRDP